MVLISLARTSDVAYFGFSLVIQISILLSCCLVNGDLSGLVLKITEPQVQYHCITDNRQL